MSKTQGLKIIYWFIASILIAVLFQNALPNFWDAWLISLFMLPAALIIKYGIKKIRPLKGFKKWVRYFFIALISLYWSYIGITLAYWYFLELKANTLIRMLINPIFLWLILSFFVLLDYVLFKRKQTEQKQMVTIYSNRKRTVIQIDKIAYIESRGDFTLVIMTDGNELKNSIKISEWENRLESFLRIHRSFLVNPNLIILKGNEIFVNSKWMLPVSRGYKQKVVDYFQRV